MFKKFQDYQNIIILLIAVVIFLSPFVVNYSSLPKGYELAKVHFINLSSALISAIFLNGILTNKLTFSTRRLRNVGIVVGGLILLYIATTLFSDYKEVSITGNYFREQGLLFYSLITLVGAITYLCITRFNQIFIIWALFLSATIQAVVGITQYFKLLQTRPDLIDDGYWINGNFGQANFYSTLLVLGLICGIFLLNELFKSRGKSRYLKVFAILTGIGLIVVANVMSYSIFGWVTMVVAIAILVLYKFLNKILFYKLFILGLLVSILAGAFALTKIEENLRVEIWEASIGIFLKQLTTNPLHFIFGFGFDTLGKIFKDAGFFEGATVDRGHNLFVDIFMQVGVIGIGLCIFLIVLVLRKIKVIVQDSILFIFFFLIFIFTLKTFIHEFSAVQTYLIFVLVAAFLGILNQQREHSDSK